MTPKQFAQYIRLKTRTNATTFPDADILLYANIHKDDLAKEVKKANEDYFGIEVSRSLEAGKRNYGFPSYQLSQIKYVQAKLDGEKWQTLTEFDINSYKKPTDEDNIIANWSGKSPQFDIFGGELIIYSGDPIIDVPNGIKLWTIIYPEDITDLTSEIDMSIASDEYNFGLPTELHMVLATKVCIEYKNSKEKPIPLTEREVNVVNDQKEAINSLKAGNLDRAIVATIPYDDGQDY